MALTFDTKARIPATALTTTTANPVTADYTCGANAEILVVMILWQGIGLRTGGSPTYNGVALTQAESQAGVTEASCELWYMLHPPTVSALQISIPNTAARVIWVYVASGNAADGYTCALDDTGITETTAANPTVQVVTTVAGTLIFACVATGDNTFAPTARTGTSLYEEDISAYGGAGQYYVKAASGSQNMVWTEATSDDYGAIAAAFKEILGSVTLAVQDASHGHTAESPALVQHNILAMADASHAHTAESLALVQHNILAVADAAHGHTAENVTLTAHAASTQLVIQDGTHGHSADGPALVQHNILAIADTSHGHTADGPALVQHNILVIADGAHGHQAESPALVQHNILAIADGAHGHQADGPALVQHNILSIADGSHTHTADDPALVQHNLLSIADATHGHGADNVTLTAYDPGGVVLTIADVSHAHAADNVTLVQHHILAIHDAAHLHLADEFIFIAGGGHGKRQMVNIGIEQGMSVGMEDL